MRIYKIHKHLRFLNSVGLIVRILEGYFKTLICRKDVLRSIELAINYDCQAKCHKCYAKNMIRKDDNYLSLDEYKDLYNQARALGFIHVNITGGEPFLRKDLFEIIRIFSRDNDIMVSLVTNAVLIESEDIIKELKRAGLHTIQISLDSSIPDVHNRLRGVENLYDRVMYAARTCKENDIRVCFSTVLSPESDSNYEQIYKLCELGKKEDILILICDSAAVGGYEGKNDKLFSLGERNAILNRLLEHPYGRHHNLFNFRFKEGCPAGIEKIYITAYGDVTPCDLIHECVGSIRKEPLANIWNRMRMDERFSQKTRHCIRYLPGGLERNI